MQTQETSASLYPAEDVTPVTGNNAYRTIEKLYKQQHHVLPNRRKPVKAAPPDMTNVIDFDNPNDSLFKIQLQSNNFYETALKEYQTICPGLNLPPLEEWNVFGLKNYDGFMYVKGLIPPSQQLYWMNRYVCVK
jgi:hypothetical protein